MRITLQLLYSRQSRHESLEEVELLDLSDCKISEIQQLENCCSLQTLILSNNYISILTNLTSCHQLWSINLTGNRVKSLHGLSQFPVLGSLELSCNELEWAELMRLSHMTLLRLTLSGNPQLDSDPHYREHVVDLLPNLWVLDNRLITVRERKQVSQFFLKSESSAQPVRRKDTERVFVPTFMKDLLVNGVFGEKTTHLMAYFPASYTHNNDMDRRRLHYLAHVLEEDTKLHLKYKKEREELIVVPELSKLIETKDVDQSTTMLLILLLAHLEYELPHNVLIETLVTAKLTTIRGVECRKLFSLSRELMVGVATLLLGATAIERQEKKVEGEVYKTLFNSLNHTVELQQRKTAAISSGRPIRAVRCPQWRDEESQLRCLLASEVVQLLCLVTQFFEQINTHSGLRRLVCVATGNPRAGDIVSDLLWKAQANGGSEWDGYNDVSTFLVSSTSDVVQGKKRRGLPPKRGGHHGSGIHRTTSQLLPQRVFSVQTRALSAGHTSKPRLYSEKPHPSHYIPSLRQPFVDPVVSREMTPEPEMDIIISELEIREQREEEKSEGLPMRVVITESKSQPLLPSEEAKIEHQKNVLTKLTNRQEDTLQDSSPCSSSPPPPTSPPLPESSTPDLTIPSPHVRLLEKWEYLKSIPENNLTSTKRHSCVDPHAYPPRPSPSPPPPPSSQSTVDFQMSSNSKDSLSTTTTIFSYPAWSPVTSLPRPRQNIISSTRRLMNRREVQTQQPSHFPKRKIASAPVGGRQVEERSTDRASGGGGGGGASSSIVLMPKTAKLTLSTPKHMSVYTTNRTMRPLGKYHFNTRRPSNTRAAPVTTTRLLGEVRSLYVGGTSIT